MPTREEWGRIRDTYRRGKLRVWAVHKTTPVLAVVSDVLRHLTLHKSMYNIGTRLGNVRATGDHSLFSASTLSAIVPVAVESLRVGDPLAAVVDGALQATEVTSVWQSEPSVYTYDLSVPGPENFVLTNGLVAHNSYSIGGVSLDLEKSSKYESAYQAASELFDKMLEKAKLTVNVVKGLQQPRFGVGVRSSFGSFTGRGILSPAKYFR